MQQVLSIRRVAKTTKKFFCMTGDQAQANAKCWSPRTTYTPSNSSDGELRDIWLARSSFFGVICEQLLNQASIAKIDFCQSNQNSRKKRLQGVATSR